MAARDGDAGLPGLVGPPFQDLGQDVQGELPHGKADQVEGHQGLDPFGVDIAQGVGRCNGPEAVGIVHHGGKIVYRQDQCQLSADPVDRHIIRGLESHQKVGIVHHRQLAQDLRQVVRTELAGSAGPVA